MSNEHNTTHTRWQKATFGAGCFWGVEETFRQLPGVKSTSVGYSGGTVENPSYEQVCTDKTGHAEVVEIIFDPTEINYQQLLEVFWGNHNPTTLNRQGPDVGRQYRSVIFYHTPEQAAKAREMKAQLEASQQYDKPIVTEITPATKFYKAEDYHQQYLQKRGAKHCAI